MPGRPGVKDINELYLFALSFWGVPYQYGGELRSKEYGIDCSGYVQKILEAGGIDPPGDQTANELYWRFSTIGRPSKERGALCFFGEGAKASHVGWMIDSFCLISAAGGTPRCITPHIAEMTNANVKIQPLSYYKNFLGSWLPEYNFSR